MIRFQCKQCGRTFERPDAEAGTLVFCECGTGNRVPWRGKPVAAQEPPGEVLEDAESLPTARPVRPQPAGPRRSRPQIVAPIPAVERDPAFCLNHFRVASAGKCAGCGERFCPRCLVEFQGKTLCGPCKNFRVRLLQRPSHVSALAIVSLAIAFLSGPSGLFCVAPLAARAQAPGAVAIGLVLPLVALILAVLALRQVETLPRTTGRSLAVTALVASVVSAFMTVAFAVLAQRGMQ